MLEQKHDYFAMLPSPFDDGLAAPPVLFFTLPLVIFIHVTPRQREWSRFSWLRMPRSKTAGAALMNDALGGTQTAATPVRLPLA